ncbi:hypothetical protein [Nocardioides sp. TF02-7]|uniref:hypothetical protein n=1 Tax=Nocardioides sp. TF02-7 TaxID=2917724 RepID=UPI001F070E27|nr:hypothetical protein [Nocardioides sp. TF02-7]UMG93975.1 hypothetical protein MF408_07790 [Nocardioides sp. TF02-7]
MPADAGGHDACVTAPRSTPSRLHWAALVAGLLLGTGLLAESAWGAASRYLTAERVDTVTTGRWVDVDPHCGRYIAYTVDGREYRLDTRAGAAPLLRRQ